MTLCPLFLPRTRFAKRYICTQLGWSVCRSGRLPLHRFKGRRREERRTVAMHVHALPPRTPTCDAQAQIPGSGSLRSFTRYPCSSHVPTRGPASGLMLGHDASEQCVPPPVHCQLRVEGGAQNSALHRSVSQTQARGARRRDRTCRTATTTSRGSMLSTPASGLGAASMVASRTTLGPVSRTAGARMNTPWAETAV